MVNVSIAGDDRSLSINSYCCLLAGLSRTVNETSLSFLLLSVHDS